jgi:tRNA A-37 threonylcarbamoyl transferase component Bud32/tetratricopeptide (TPR) repeat protein
MSTSATISGSFAHRYTIERELGRGATSTVYLANDTTAARDVALKVLRRELAQSVAADRFLREVRLNQSLQHRYITPVLDSGEFEGDLFLVLPHMQGGSLRQLLERERQLSIEAVLEIVRSIGEGLQYAHERGLIHRDVKPENILFAGNQAYLADFGIARAIQRASGDTTTEAGVVRGTPGYMSPEQASGDRNYDGRSDQYSFACVVYEMLAGVPAFHGPTPEATIALRFRHPARKLNVYRSTVPAAVEGVIEKAMAIAPADRYVSVGDFVKAFEAAIAPPPEPTSVSTPLPRADRRRTMVAVAAGACVVVALATYGAAHAWFTGRGVPADTTQVVVFPLEVGAATNGTVPHELFHTALRRWQDLHVVPLAQTSDALARRGSGRLAPEEMRSITIRLGARRFVVVGPVRTPTGNALFAEYHDVEAGSLHEAQLDLPSDSSRVAAMYAALADSMVLRGGSDGGVPGGTGPRHLFATQAFVRGANARQEWNLTRADSELALAVSLDPGFSRAYLWQAQQKSWAGIEAQGWIALVERALADTTALTPPERLMAHALASLGRGQYPEACSNYKTLIKSDSMSFVGWYGLGECNQKDHIVVSDARSASSWRFRGSFQEAVTSYARAFQLIPATYRGFQQNGYRRLQELLFMSGNRVNPGHSLGPPAQSFFGLPTLAGDTVLLVPWPQATLTSQRVSITSPFAVVTHLRSVFDTVVTRWASAFPRSAATKEAVAISLDIQGEAAAVDTLEAAERLTTDPRERVRLAASRLSMQLKLGASGSGEVLARVLTSADSLLDANGEEPAPEIAGLLAPVSAMTGRCVRTSKLLRQSQTTAATGPVPRDIVADIAELEAYVSVGCRAADVWRRLDAIGKSIAGPQPSAASKQTEYMQLNGIVRAIVPPDSAWVTRLAPLGGRTIVAERYFVEGRLDSARARLRDAARARQGAFAGQVTAEAVVPEARVWLMLADTTSAIASLEAALNTARRAPPLLTDEARYNTGRMGFLIQAYALHAMLLAGRDRARARQSAKIAVTMWRYADAELQPTVARLRDIMK